MRKSRADSCDTLIRELIDDEPDGIAEAFDPRPAGMSSGIEADRRCRALTHFSHSRVNPRRLLAWAKAKAVDCAMADLAATVQEFIARSYALESLLSREKN